jgi:release factor glutamine methyltransferase
LKNKITVSELINNSSKLFKEISSSPRLDAELLLSYVLGVDRTKLLMHPELIPEQKQINQYLEYESSRKEGKPVAYIRGFKEFWGLCFKVTPAVLIPRPETEHLVELAIKHIKEKLVKPLKKPVTCIDLGTGSGVISLTLAKTFQTSVEQGLLEIYAVDISNEALLVAKDNEVLLGLSGKVNFLKSDWWSAVTEANKFDLILTNPPYVEFSDEVKRDLSFEPHRAIFSDEKGYKDIFKLIDSLEFRLEDTGIFLSEIGYGQYETILGYIAKKTFRKQYYCRDIKDLAQISRVLEFGYLV